MNPLDMFRNAPLMAAGLALGIGADHQSAARLSLHARTQLAFAIERGRYAQLHATLVSSLAWAIGLEYGFKTPEFAVAFVFAGIVIYDATGVRRAAGQHARVINRMIDDLAAGHPLKEEELKEASRSHPAPSFCRHVVRNFCRLSFLVMAESARVINFKLQKSQNPKIPTSNFQLPTSNLQSLISNHNETSFFLQHWHPRHPSRRRHRCVTRACSTDLSHLYIWL